MKLTPRYAEPQIISTTGAPDDQRVPVSRQRRRLEAMLAELDDDAWRAPTRCAAWSVQDVVAHLVSVNEFWNASVHAGLAGTPTRVLAAFDPAATPPLIVGPMRELSPAQVLERFLTSNTAFLDTIAVLDEAGWSALAESPPGHVSVRLLAQHALWDSWIHERDIALPLGSIPVVEPDEVRSCLQYVIALSPALSISTGNPATGVFSIVASDPDVSFVIEIGLSAAVREHPPVPDAPCLRGDGVALVEALSLRTPLPESTPAQWRQLLAGLATTFDAEVSSI
jgi:uncharacterized protein (TIGR03083 family)